MKITSILLSLLAISVSLQAATTVTYQGRLDLSGGPLTGTADLEFRLYNSPSGCCQQGPTESRPDWPVDHGLFQVELDFGANYAGERWLEIRVDGTTLSPRQKLTAAPSAVQALGPWQSAGSSGIHYPDAGVGIGTTPNTSNRLRVRADHAAQNALNVIDHEGVTRLRVAANGGVAAGTSQLPPAGGLRVGTQVGIGTAPRQQLSVGNRLDLYSGAPNNPTAPSIRANPGTSNLVISAIDEGALFFNFDSGSGGVRFHNGTAAGGELMRLTGKGRLGVGTASPSSKLHVVDSPLSTAVQIIGGVAIGNNTDFGFNNTLNVDGRIRIGLVTGTGDQDLCRNSAAQSIVVCSSTASYKQAVVSLENAGSLVDRLRPVRFEWIEDGRSDLGLIAEEVVEVLPELVYHDGEGAINGVNYRHLTAVLIGAIQEQRAANRALNAEVAALQVRLGEVGVIAERNTALEARLAALESIIEATALAASPGSSQ